MILTAAAAADFDQCTAQIDPDCCCTAQIGPDSCSTARKAPAHRTPLAAEAVDTDCCCTAQKAPERCYTAQTEHREWDTLAVQWSCTEMMEPQQSQNLKGLAEVADTASAVLSQQMECDSAAQGMSKPLSKLWMCGRGAVMSVHLHE